MSDFLRSYLMRPELSPIPESCAAELALHDALLANPLLDFERLPLTTKEDYHLRYPLHELGRE